MIAIKGLQMSYTTSTQLSFLDWTIKKGDHWLLLGNSGSGKSTLLHILTGILAPDRGEVLINGTNLYQLSNRQRDHFRGQNIGVILQKAHLINSFTARENLMLAQSFAGLKVNENRINEVLSSLGMLAYENSYPHQLSQGQVQRIAIARAVINKPALLLADEPTSSLDDDHTTAVLNLLMEQSALNKATLIVATHDKRVKDVFSNAYLM